MVGALIGAACGGSAALLGSNSAPDVGFVDLATAIPVRLDSQIVLFSDIDRAAEQFSYVRRCDDADVATDTVAELTFPKVEDGLIHPFALVPTEWNRAVLDNESMRAELGFGVCDIDAYAEDVSADIIERPLVVRTSRLADIDAVVRNEPRWSDELVATQTGSATTYVWGDDPLATDPERTSGVRPLGRGGSLHVDPERNLVLRTIDPVGIDGSLRAGEQGRSLADDEWATLILAAADEAGAHTVVLVRPLPASLVAVTAAGSSLLDGDELGEALEVLDGVPLSKPAVWMAGAWSLTSDGDLQILVLAAHTSEDEAAANVEALGSALNEGASVVSGQPWRNTFGTFDLEQRGRVVVATSIRTPEVAVPPAAMLTAVFQRDVLFAFDDS